MHLDPLLPALVAFVFAILLTGIVMRALRQPFVIGCLVVGVLLGPQAVGLLTDLDLVTRMGSLGVVLLLFFVGIELSPPRLVESWRIALFGTGLQVLVSVGCIALVGLPLGWSFSRILLLGFVISLSSTAVVLRLLEQRGEMQTPTGRNVIVILISQDLAVVPMIIAIGLLAGARTSPLEITLQIAGGIGLLLLFGFLIRKREIHLPLARFLEGHDEMQVFAALLPCLGLALLTGLLGLSTGLGALAGGLLLSLTRETRWVSKSLRPFEALFLGVFFVSVGMLVDLGFLGRNLPWILLIVLVVLLTNTFVNAVVLRMLGVGWRESIYAGSLLAQVGELSFILAAIGRQTELITDFAYQMTVATIVLSMISSPVWISLLRRVTQPTTR